MRNGGSWFLEVSQIIKIKSKQLKLKLGVRNLQEKSVF